MSWLKYVVAAAFTAWLAVASVLVIVNVAATAISMTRLYLPETAGLGRTFGSTTLEVYTANDNKLFYKKNYRFGGLMPPDSDIKIASAIIEIMRDESEFSLYAQSPFWYKSYLKFKNIESATPKAFILESYTKSLADLTNYKGIKRNFLKLYFMKDMSGNYSDDELFRLYMDSVYFNRDIQGISGAAYAYFKKDYNSLTPLEITFLLLKVLTDIDDKELEQVAKTYLSKLYRKKIISQQLYKTESEKKLEMAIFSYPEQNAGLVSYLVDNMNDYYPDVNIGKENVKIYIHNNEAAEKSARKAIEKIYENAQSVQVGFLFVNVQTGAIEATIGGRYTSNYVNRALQFKRKAGSMFMPVVYASAFNQGILPSEIIKDNRHLFMIGDEAYSPDNHNSKFYGDIPLRNGLVYSLNNATILTAKKTGIVNVIEIAHKMGIKEHLSTHLSTAIGNFNISPVEVATVFTTIANNGIYKNITPIAKIFTDSGNTMFDNKTVQVVDEISAYQTMYILQATAVEGSAKDADVLQGTVIKTGVSDNKTDYWVAAYTAPYVAVLWVGNDDGTALPLSVKEELLAETIADFHRDYFGDKKFLLPAPDGITYKYIDKITGQTSSGGNNSYIEALRKN